MKDKALFLLCVMRRRARSMATLVCFVTLLMEARVVKMMEFAICNQHHLETCRFVDATMDFRDLDVVFLVSIYHVECCVCFDVFLNLKKAPPKRICDPTNFTDTPPECTFCDPNAPPASSGCFNGGICYYRPTPGVPPPGLPLCGCTYGLSPPSCFYPAPRLPLCDPYNITKTYPECQYCYPEGSPGSNGCLGYGHCELVPTSGPGIPPNFELPLCDCQGLLIPPMCVANLFDATQNSDLIPYLWVLVACYIVAIILSVLVIAQHIYYGVNYRFIFTNQTRIAGAFCIFLSALFGAMVFGINFSGLKFGFPTKATLVGDRFLTNLAVVFITIGIAISTANWIWLGSSAVTPMHKVKDQWPLPATIMVLFVSLYTIVIGTVLAWYQIYYLDSQKVVIALCGATILALLVFSLISGGAVLLTISDMEASDPKLLTKTARQLLIVGFFELIAAVSMMTVTLLPSEAYGTDVSLILGVAVFIPGLAFFFLQILLLWQFRIAVWQLRQLNPGGKPNSKTANSKTGDSHVYRSKHMMSGESAEETDGNISNSNKAKEVQDFELDSAFEKNKTVI